MLSTGALLMQGERYRCLSDSLVSHLPHVTDPSSGSASSPLSPSSLIIPSVSRSLVAFVWANDSAICQGPKKVYPAVTFAKFMDVKSAGFDFILSKSEEIFEHAQGLNIALGNPTVTATA